MNSQVIKPTSSNQSQDNYPGIFLAGSIDMGSSVDWQTEVQNKLDDCEVTFFNPRRDEWDSSWEQRESNDQFRKQVNWEMDKLEQSDIIFFNFVGNTKSPISLLELGLHADENIIVCCPDEFWRKGNVEIVCSRFGIPLFDNLDQAIASLKSKIHKFTHII
jgi:hypothetical protein